ncbi:PASTA domain-containing protein [Serinibacter arcticus]|uniref:PASTA domain-containing protein n=1 Tax=Serinibacter arcticus TaxID=1655435 RepID=UPI0011B232FD|nr:PASTA domain-containing protein [Serinibacter arcticus]
MLETSVAFDLADPPHSVRLAQRAMLLALASSLTADQLQGFGLTGASVGNALAEGLDASASEIETLGLIWKLGQESDDRWRSLLSRLRPEEPEWVDLIGVEMVAYNPLFPESLSLTGRVGLRTAGAFDALGLEITPLEVADSYSEMCAEIARHKTSTMSMNAIRVSSTALRMLDVATVTGGIAGSWIDKGSGALIGFFEAADDRDRDLALAWWYATALHDAQPSVTTRVLRHLKVTAQEHARKGERDRLRATNAVIADLAGTDSLHEDRDASSLVPDAINLPLDAAINLAGAAGFTDVRLVDAYPTNGVQREPMMRSRWVVRYQKPSAGESAAADSAVVLAYSRPGERVRDHIAHQLMEERLRKPS